MNEGVRTRPGKDGEPVIVADYCRRCRCEVLPSLHGRCNWCELRVVDYKTLVLPEAA